MLWPVCVCVKLISRYFKPFGIQQWTQDQILSSYSLFRCLRIDVLSSYHSTLELLLYLRSLGTKTIYSLHSLHLSFKHLCPYHNQFFEKQTLDRDTSISAPVGEDGSRKFCVIELHNRSSQCKLIYYMLFESLLRRCSQSWIWQLQRSKQEKGSLAGDFLDSRESELGYSHSHRAKWRGVPTRSGTTCKGIDIAWAEFWKHNAKARAYSIWATPKYLSRQERS